MNRAFLFNTVTVIFLLLTVIFLAFVGVQLASPPPPTPVVEVPTLVDLPTLTPTFTPTRTIPPTFTSTPSSTPTPSETPTDTPTITPSRTITNTLPPPTISPTPENTATFTPTATSSEPTPIPSPSESPYIFGSPDAIRYTANFANSLGCAWQGIGGQIFDLNGVEYRDNFQVRVYNNTFERTVPIGSNSIYGPLTGWEVQVSNTVNAETYFVRLESSLGSQISDVVQVTFPQDCAQNVALVNFRQRRPLPNQTVVAPVPPNPLGITPTATTEPVTFP